MRTCTPNRRALRIYGAVVCSVWLSACGSGGCGLGSVYPTFPNGESCLLAPLRFERFLSVGVEAEVEFGVDEYCVPSIPEAAIPRRSNAVVDIVDPSGKSVLHKDMTPERRTVARSHYEEVVKVKFTPDRAGTWTLSANLGSALNQEAQTTQSLEVIQSRSDAAVRIIPWKDMPADCLGYGITDRETAFCVSHRAPHLDGGQLERSSPALTTSRGRCSRVMPSPWPATCSGA